MRCGGKKKKKNQSDSAALKKRKIAKGEMESQGDLENVWEGLDWVPTITDPSLHLDRLHEAFEKVIFSGPPPDEDEGEEEGDEEDEEESLENDFKDALAELEDNAVDDDDDEGSNIFDKISENEELEQMEDEIENEDWETWVRGGFQKDSHDTDELEARDAVDVENQLERVGLGEQDAVVQRDTLPERFKIIALAEKRDQLGPKKMGDGTGITIDRQREAVWILRQLSKPGQPYAASAAVKSLLQDSYNELVESRLVRAIEYALVQMVQMHLEPAHLMVYHQTRLSALLEALWYGSTELQHFQDDTPNASFPYCLTSGRRQRPKLSPGDVVFESRSYCDGNTSSHIGTEDNSWGTDVQTPMDVCRKPCVIELGRILVTILELDVLCHRLEHLRQSNLRRITNLGRAYITQTRILEQTVFESIVEADIWGAYTSFLASSADSRGIGASKKIKRLGLEAAFEEYSLTGQQYHENLFENYRSHRCSKISDTQDLFAWAQQVGQSCQEQLSADQVLDLFNRSIVEQFSRLPVLRKRVFDAFLADGEIIVTPLRGNRRTPKSISIATLIQENPRWFTELRDQERHEIVKLSYVLDERIVHDIMDTRRLYDAGDKWSEERRTRAINTVVARVMEEVRPNVCTALERIAQVSIQRLCCERLGTLCSEGPYEPTRLCLEAYDVARRTWESEWNIVEALPVCEGSSSMAGRARVCAAYRGENGVTCFTFADEHGTVCGHVRWSDCAMQTTEGRINHQRQLFALKAMIQKFSPNVIAVAVTGEESIPLMQSLERFVREGVHTEEFVHIPVVWANPTIAIVSAHSVAMQNEMPHADTVTKTSICLSRYVRDPLLEICRLFDSNRTALHLPIGTARATQESHLFTALEWEMTLWVNAIGVDIRQVTRLSSPASALQFVAGFGPRKASKLLEHFRLNDLSSRSELFEMITQRFGPSVATNSVGCLRVAPSAAAVGYHPMDCTIIPPSWYPIAERMASMCCSVGDFCADLPLFLMLAMPDKRAHLANHLNPEDAANMIHDLCHAEWSNVDRNEVRLIADELVNWGSSRMRRPYRLLTNKTVFKLLTGIAFISRSDQSHLGVVASNALSICEGDTLQCVVAGIRGGSVTGIRVNTTRGVQAFISAEDLGEEILKVELANLVLYMEEVKSCRLSNVPVTTVFQVPDWLKKGSLIYGTVIGCNYERAEIRLRWSKAPCSIAEIEPEAADDPIDVRADARSVNSVLTAQIVEAAAVNRMKISRHDLFKNVSMLKATELLRDKSLGECLIRASKGRKNEAMICVKIGDVLIANWPIREERTSNGTFVYVIHDKRTNRRFEFQDVDHCLDAFIKRAVEKASMIRSHRKFVADNRDVRSRLNEDEVEGKGFAYAFAESRDDEQPQTFYRLYYRLKGHDRSLKLHLDHQHIHIRLPLGNQGDNQQTVFEWVPCPNAEAVAAVMKAWLKSRMMAARRR